MTKTLTQRIGEFFRERRERKEDANYLFGILKDNVPKQYCSDGLYPMYWMERQN